MSKKNCTHINRSSKRMHYPSHAIRVEFTYTIVGLLFSLVPITLTPALPEICGILSFLALLFFLFGLRTIIRQYTSIEISENKISVSGLLGFSITWSEIQELKLSYFSTRREKSDGWMQLKLGAHNHTLRVDSSLSGFSKLVSEAVKNTLGNGLKFSPKTIQNLKVLGVHDF